MIPTGFIGIEGQLWLWMMAMIRPGAAFLVAPVFGAAAVPMQLRLVISLAVGIAGLEATHFILPPDGLTSAAGILMVMGEVLAGLAIGFAVQIGFAAAMVAGEVISNAMGLGFSAMIDPASGHSNPVIGQFLTTLCTFLFLATGGHLALIATIVESYRALPPGDAWLSAEAIRGLVYFGSVLFASGLSIALPVGFAILLVQVVMAMLARTAPQLNLFAVGMPAALLAGIVLLAMALPVLGEGLIAALRLGLEHSQALAMGRAG